MTSLSPRSYTTQRQNTCQGTRVTLRAAQGTASSEWAGGTDLLVAVVVEDVPESDVAAVAREPGNDRPEHLRKQRHVKGQQPTPRPKRQRRPQTTQRPNPPRKKARRRTSPKSGKTLRRRCPSQACPDLRCNQRDYMQGGVETGLRHLFSGVLHSEELCCIQRRLHVVVALAGPEPGVLHVLVDFEHLGDQLGFRAAGGKGKGE